MVCRGHWSNGADPRAAERRYARGFCQYKKVSDRILRGHYRRLFLAGDLQQTFGRLHQHRQFYTPTYGRLMRITEPAPGNHDSYTSDSRGAYAGYREYFGRRAHWNRRGGSYSFDLGSWHIISLDSQWCGDFTWAYPDKHWENVPLWSKDSPWGCHKGDLEFDWLVRDMYRHSDSQCTLAYFHHPAYFWIPYAGGPDVLVHDGYTKSRPLYRYGADVVLNGHQHFHQRFQPMNPKAQIDAEYGLTEFIVATGEDTLQQVPPASKQPEQVAAADNTTFGFLRLNLYRGGYAWRFVPARGFPGRWRDSKKYDVKILENGTGGGGTVDSGSASCHGAPPEGYLSSGG